MDKTILKVLLVEDNPGDARLVSIMLSEAEDSLFVLKRVECMADGIVSLEQEKFDVILLDMDLPDSHGVGTFNQIKRSASLTPVILMTGNDDKALALQIVKAGAQDYLVKGKINTELLERAMRYAVERQKTLEEIKTLCGLIPICASCKKIRDDQGYWQGVEKYIEQHSFAEFSHGICPDCIKKLYPEYSKDMPQG